MSDIPDDVMKSATNVATALLYPEVDDDGRAYLTQEHINIIGSALVDARAKALEEAAMRVDKLISDMQALEKFNRSYALRMTALAAEDIRSLQSDAP